MKKRILITGLIIILAGLAAGAYLFNKPRQSIRDTSPEVSINATKLVSDYETDELLSNKKYLGKVVEVSGIVDGSSLDEKGILNVVPRGGDLAGVGCQFENSAKPKKINLGESITIKGICTGILMDVVLVECVIE